MPQIQQQNLTPEMFVPSLAERPESKPIYNSVRQVKQYERIAGCMENGKSCNCYGDQATKLKEISTELCRSYVRDGLPFDPFRDKPQPQQQIEQVEQETREPENTNDYSQVVTLGGEPKVPAYEPYPENLRNIQ